MANPNQEIKYTKVSILIKLNISEKLLDVSKFRNKKFKEPI